jgi:uncharacterized repeat protein (TIGR01451 family)
LQIIKDHTRAVSPGGTLTYQITFSARCETTSTFTVSDVFPAALTVLSATVTAPAVINVSGNSVTATVTAKQVVGRVTVTALVPSTVPVGSTITNVATVADGSGGSAASEDVVRVIATRRDQRLVLHGHLKSRPGRQLTYTSRYFNVSANNRLTLTIPPRVSVLRINPPPQAIDGRTYIWSPVSPVSGYVRITVRLDADLPYGVFLPASTELVDDFGRETDNHATTVVLPASAGQFRVFPYSGALSPPRAESGTGRRCCGSATSPGSYAW